ncbi:MAG: DNA recombination protein RmuC [Desulfomonilia bacterium]|jgi:DNA recombination protein RmuC
MEYLLLAVTFIIGGIAGWFFARAQYSGELKAGEKAAADSLTLESRLRQELIEARDLLEKERLERARLETRLQEAQASLTEQKVLLDNAARQLTETFKALSLDALNQNNQAFIQLAGKTMEAVVAEMKGDFEKRQGAVEAVVKPLEESLKRYETQIQAMEGSRQSAYGDISRHIEELVKMQDRLTDQTRTLASALKEPQARGRWGEITLKRVVELSGMSSHCDFIEQPVAESETGRKRPDLIVKLPGDRQVVIDAKVPLRAYLEAYEATDPSIQATCLGRHARSVRDHMNALASKEYWKQFTPTPDFVVLFLPGEAFFSAALDQDKTLIEDGIEKRILIATPVTLIALLRSVAMSWQQQSASENAHKIWETGVELFDRLKTFVRHFDKIRDGLQKATESYNTALGSFESRILPSANRLKDLTAPEHGEALECPEPVEVALRSIAAPGDDQPEGGNVQ